MLWFKYLLAYATRDLYQACQMFRKIFFMSIPVVIHQFIEFNFVDIPVKRMLIIRPGSDKVMAVL